MRAITTALVLAMLVAACGGGPGGEPGGATQETPPTTAAPPAASDTQRAEPRPDAPVDDLAAGLNDAGFRLWREQAIEDNLVFSPLSIGHALLMARGAADEPTGAAIDAAFGLPGGIAAHEAWNAIDHAIASSADAEDELTATIADRIWPRLDVTPDREWVDVLAAHHGVSVEPLDFEHAPEDSRETINRWVSERTDELIPELLPEGFVEPRTVLILTDALYFEARWQTVFGKYGTESARFTLLDGSTVPVELMRELELSDRRGAGDGFVGAEIPYVGGDFSMLVIVPDEGRFEEIRGTLDRAFLDRVDADFTTGPYELLLPEWDDTANLDLIPWLTELGAAPGSYPAISPDAFLDGAVHAADISVDETGTVAAAATGLGFLESGPPEPELVVSADQPFLYLIRHRPTGAVLFAGQVVDPSS
jgi:serpin B